MGYYTAIPHMPTSFTYVVLVFLLFLQCFNYLYFHFHSQFLTRKSAISHHIFFITVTQAGCHAGREPCLLVQTAARIKFISIYQQILSIGCTRFSCRKEQETESRSFKCRQPAHALLPVSTLLPPCTISKYGKVEFSLSCGNQVQEHCEFIPPF